MDKETRLGIIYTTCLFFGIILFVTGILFMFGVFTEKTKVQNNVIIPNNEIIKSIVYGSPEYNNLSIEDKQKFEKTIKGINKNKTIISMHQENK
jgi:hypothetical protein